MLQNQPIKLNDPVPKRLKLMGAWAVKHMQNACVPPPLARAGEAKATVFAEYLFDQILRSCL